MSLDHFRGTAHAYRELFRLAQADIARGDGDLKPAIRKWKTAHPSVHIGWFKRRLLRGEFKRRKA